MQRHVCIGLGGVFLFLSPVPASAVITMSPSNGGSLGGTTSFYFVQFLGSNPLTSLAFLPPGVTPLDITKSAYSGDDAAAGYPNRFEIGFYSDVAVNLVGSQKLVVTFQSYPIASLPVHPAPIATVNGIACDSIRCQGYDAVALTGHYFAAKYTPRTTIRIGFYPKDICADYKAAGGIAVGCAESAVNPPTDTSSTTQQLTYAVTVVGDETSFPSTATGTSVAGSTVTGTVVDQTVTPVSYTFEDLVPTLSCPDATTLNKSVIPGDGRIFLDTTSFGFTLASPAAGAPGAGLVAVAQDTSVTAALPDVSSDYLLNNSLSIRIGIGNSVTPVLGFKNSTSDETHAYQLSFIGQDRAGLYVSPSSVSNCLLKPVVTSSIQGFLGKSNCFIATAAFRSIDAPPVVLLREFRDSVLLTSSLGRDFVHWYYGWSPPAAEWLMLHPVFRFPVLLLLMPVEVFAWLCLHPGYFYSLLGSFIIIFLVLGGHELFKREKELR